MIIALTCRGESAEADARPEPSLSDDADVVAQEDAVCLRLDGDIILNTDRNVAFRRDFCTREHYTSTDNVKEALTQQPPSPMNSSLWTMMTTTVTNSL